MFRDQQLTRPQNKSLLLTMIITALMYFGSSHSPFTGYFTALLVLIAIILASIFNSFWPTKAKAENSFIFSLFWGGIIGVVLPLLFKKFMEGGFKAIYELIVS
jgi:uncharacterized membrane protein